VPWPPRARDLTPVDYFVKSLIHDTSVDNEFELLARIIVASDVIRETPGIIERVLQGFCRRCNACIENGGRQFQHLLLRVFILYSSLALLFYVGGHGFLFQCCSIRNPQYAAEVWHQTPGRPNTTQILREDPSTQLPHITIITTTMEQATKPIRICSGHKVLNKTCE
jgi:hypothetical protein